MARRGVTVMEFLVVVAILAIVLAMFFPAVNRVREAARETVCKNNVAQINLALSQYDYARPVFNPITFLYYKRNFCAAIFCFYQPFWSGNEAAEATS